MEWYFRVHLQQWRNQSHRHNHTASVSQEDQTSREAGAYGVQVRTGLCLPLQLSHAGHLTQGTEKKEDFESLATGHRPGIMFSWLLEIF